MTDFGPQRPTLKVDFVVCSRLASNSAGRLRQFPTVVVVGRFRRYLSVFVVVVVVVVVDVVVGVVVVVVVFDVVVFVAL